jgi:cell wall-associated NlpC family hydrolase
MSDLSTLAQHAQTQAANNELPDDERALWWQIAEEVIDYLEPTDVMVGEVTLERGLFDE